MANRSRVIGLTRTIRGIHRLYGNARASAKRHLHGEGEQIMGISKTLVPVLTGALRASGHVPPVEERGHAIVQRMSYGNTAVDYAAAVHERTDIPHQTGIAKFLSLPAEAAAVGLADRLARAVARDLERARPGL